MICTLQPRSYRLRHPFLTSGWTMTTRDVILIRIEDPFDGAYGWGEAAPLPPFGTESLATAQHVLTMAAELLKGAHTSSLRALAAEIPGLQGAPTARFALETALLDLHARRKGIPVADLLADEGWNSQEEMSDGTAVHTAAAEDRVAAEPGSVRRVPVNTVIGAGGTEGTVQAAVAAVMKGFTCLKLKIGRGMIDEDVDRIRAVRAAIPTDILLRLDANGAWDFGLAEEALHRLRHYDIEYVEQPVPPDQIDELAALTGLGIVPIAADESAQNLSAARALVARAAADVYVLKPMAAGSLLEARRFAIDARAHGAEVVFTSLIDSSVGRHAVAQLAASLPFPLRHQGLATGRLFEEDSARDRIEKGDFLLPDSPGLGILPLSTSANV
ncbi:MAG: o-succinylbenzoate synthase [Bacteroidetes bacterium]|nr:o-succinylbenzoate synthase [Bacteroidota bacterium]